MVTTSRSRFLSLFISFSLLVGPLPLSAIAEAIAANLSDLEINNEIKKTDNSYVYLGKDVSNIAEIITRISNLDDQKNSPLAELKYHIEQGFFFAEYNAVIETLAYAETVLQKQYSTIPNKEAERLTYELNTIINDLTTDTKSLQYSDDATQNTLSPMTRAHVRSLIINENIDVLGKGHFHQHIRTKQGITASGKLKVGKSALFKSDVEIQGSLSVADIIINDCINDLCVNQLSVVDESVSGTLSVNNAVIQNAKIEDLTVTATTLDEIVNNLTVNQTLSVNEAMINNGAITNLSTTSAIAQDLTVINALHLLDPGPGYIGLQAPITVPTSYTLTLPAAVPTANQMLRANATIPTNLEWFTKSGSVPPADSKTIYVTKYGNDITGNGSFDAPYASLTQAIALANSLASDVNPINILISPGIYIEDNSVNPLTLTAHGISIVGEVSSGVVLIPNTPTKDFLLVNAPTHISDIALQSFAALATGIILSEGNLTTITNVDFVNFLVGVNCVGGPDNSYGFMNCFFANNGTALLVDNAYVSLNSNTIFGATVIAGPSLNNAITVTGSGANLVINGGLIGLCETGITITNNAFASITGTAFRLNGFDIEQNGASHTTFSACTFELTQDSSDIDLHISDAGTIAEVIGCEFSGSGILGTPQGTAIFVENNGSINISGGNMHNYTTAMHIGTVLNSSSTIANASGLLINNCATDILQQGSTTIRFNACTATSDRITITDSANVEMAFFDLDDNGALTIGSTMDQDTILLQAAVNNTKDTVINYKSSLYGTKAIGLDNSLNNPSTWFVLSPNKSHFTAITTDRDNTSHVCLLSDTGSPVGGTSALRGWDITKNGSTAELLFNYQNSDSSGQVVVPEHTVMQLDGLNNQLQLPTVNTQIVFAGDTNLYRDSANFLKTDDNFIVGTLTPDRAIVTDATTNQLSSSTTTGTELGYVSGVTSSIQGQLNNKVSRSGDSMTGALRMLTQNAIQFQDLFGQYVGINAPSTVPASYTVSLPTTAPAAHQIMRTNGTTPTDLEWFTTGGSVIPADSKTIYVAKYGNDITGDGSSDAPYASLSTAITIANSLANVNNPIAIFISPGIYIEDNSTGPLAITSDGISIIGYSPESVYIMPSTSTNDFILANATVYINSLAIESFMPVATGLSFTAGNLSICNNVRFANFQTGVKCSGGTTQLYGFINCAFIANGTALRIDTCRVESVGSSFFGTAAIAVPAANTGINITGSGGNIVIDGGAIAKCNVGLTLTNNSTITSSATSFKFNTYDIIQDGASHLVLNGASFELTNGNSDVDIQISGAGTMAEIIGCQFNGKSVLGTPEGTCICVSDNANLDISSGSIKNYSTALQVGVPADTASTQASVSGCTITNCSVDIQQEGSTTLNVNASTASSNKITINDSTNVKLAYFDLNSNNQLTIGSNADINTGLIAVSIDAIHPGIDYFSSLYATQAIGFNNPLSNPSSLFSLSSDNTNLTAVTTDRTKITGLRLISDEGSPVGGTSALRGWDITKNSSSAELSFNYQNSDNSGQIVIPEYTVMQLDGVNNQLQLPTTGTKIVFDNDTNLYRSAANVLKTDDNFIIGTLTPGNTVITDASTNQLSSSATTATELSYVHGATSSIQTQLDNKVSKTGDSMSGALNMLAQNAINFKDSMGNFVGINAPLTVPLSYTVSLPSTVPTANQVLCTDPITPTKLKWTTNGGLVLPVYSKTIYVAQYGNDITGDGSLNNPFASLAQAIVLANAISTTSNPIVIKVSAGIYTEDNSAGPLTVTADGIAIIGESSSNVIITPNTPTNDLLLINNPIQINTITFESPAPLATGIVLNSGGLPVVNSVNIVNFLLGIDCAAQTPTTFFTFANCFFSNNITAFSASSGYIECMNTTIFGSASLDSPANTGINAGGTTSIALDNSIILACTTGVNITDTADICFNTASLRDNKYSVVQGGSSYLAMVGCTLELTTGSSDITVQSSGPGTLTEIMNCNFKGFDVLNVPQGTSIMVTNGATVSINGGIIHGYITGLQVGSPSDTASTVLSATSLVLEDCTNDVIQQGSATLNFNAVTAASSKISINNPTNVVLSFFDQDSNDSLFIGSTADQDTSLLQAGITITNNPEINYKTSLYSTKAIGFTNPLNYPSSWFVTSQGNSNFTAITTDRTQIAGLRLVSDEGSPIGGTSALRGWDINKNGSAAQLSFNYQNSDVVGQTAISEYTVMQLDGVNNQFQLPTNNTQIVFGNDTNLYRGAANVLKTDDNFIVGTLTPDRVIVTDAGTNQLSSSTITGTELSYLSGVTSLIQPQINSKVTKTGDSMSGSLTMLAQNAVRFNDSINGAYVGINAPSIIPASYTLSLPTTAPTTNQTLRSGALTPTNLTWVTEGGSIPPVNSKTIYVAKYGNDSTGDGSSDTPYASLAQAINLANSLASLSNPITIFIQSGMYVEDNSAGPLAITANGISIVGASSSGVIVMPNTSTNDLLLVNNAIQIINMEFQSSTPLATGIAFAAGDFTTLNNVRCFNFLVGLHCSGGSSNTYVLDNCLFVGNITAIQVNDTKVQNNNPTIVGSSSVEGPAANVGLEITGASSQVIMTGGVIAFCTNGTHASSNALLSMSAVNFRYNTFDIIQDSASNMTLSGCSFEITNGSSDIDIQISGAGTIARLVSCEFDGDSITGVPQGTAIVITDNASVNISAGCIHNYTTGIQIGAPGDTSSTAINCSAFAITNCTTDIIQGGSSTIYFSASDAKSSKISINDATNVNLAFFDLDESGALHIGSTANKDTILLQVDTGSTNHPGINYKSSLYSTQAIGVENLFGSASSLYSLSANTSDIVAITTDRTKAAGIRLVSDTGLPVGGTTALRGWDINKNGTTAELSFTYQNSDLTGQTAVSPFMLMQLDGVNNQLQLPATGTQIVFDTDTNLYRSAANVLKTDDSLIVGTLTAGRVVVTDAITNQLSSSATTSTEIGYLSGVTSSVQTQLNNKVSKTGDTMTGALQLPAGTTALPSLNFTGSTTTGLSAITGNLSLSTAALERMKISAGGTVSINAFGTAGVVHNDVSGNLSTSLVVNSDIDPAAAIVDTKLAMISTAGKVANSATTGTNLNTPSTLVLRDGVGNFSAGIITANVSGNATTATTATNFSGSLSGDVTGTQLATVVSFVGGKSAASIANSVNLTNAATNSDVASTIVRRDGSGSFSTNTISVVDEVISNSLVLPSFMSSGVVHNNSAGLLSSSLIINADIDPLASIVDTKLATISTAGKVANSATTATSTNTINTIVARDASGNFSAGTITASLSGNATTATTATNFSGLLSGDVTGTQGATVVSFVGGQTAANVVAATVLANAATSANTASTIVRRNASGNFSAGAISVTDEVVSSSLIITPFSSAGVVHNNASGLLSSSLIVNADIDAAANIADTKLATISTAGKIANSATTATSANTASAIVARDTSGNFSANSVSLNDAIIQNLTISGCLTNVCVTALSAGDESISGTLSVNDEVLNGTLQLSALTSAGILHNDTSGNISSSLIVNADIDAAAAIADTKLAMISTAGKVANSATTATSTNTASAIVARDGSGNFSAGIITANVSGNATTATTATNFSGSLSGDVTGTQGATVVSSVGGQTAANVAAATVLANAATSANTASAIVKRAATGGFSAGAISVTDEVVSSSLTITPFITAGVVHNNASGLLSSSLIVDGDITSATISNAKLATISSTNTSGNIVVRDGSGNFATNMITLSGTTIDLAS